MDPIDLSFIEDLASRVEVWRGDVDKLIQNVAALIVERDAVEQAINAKLDPGDPEA